MCFSFFEYKQHAFSAGIDGDRLRCDDGQGLPVSTRKTQGTCASYKQGATSENCHLQWICRYIVGLQLRSVNWSDAVKHPGPICFRSSRRRDDVCVEDVVICHLLSQDCISIRLQEMVGSLRLPDEWFLNMGESARQYFRYLAATSRSRYGVSSCLRGGQLANWRPVIDGPAASWNLVINGLSRGHRCGYQVGP